MKVWVRKCASFAEEREADREFCGRPRPTRGWPPSRSYALNGRLKEESVTKDFEELFACLNARSVNTLIVGGHAVAFHAKPRFTKDIDLFVEPTVDNAQRLLLALKDFGFGDVDLSIEDFTTPGRVVQLGVAPNRVDLVTAIDGVTFAEAWAGRASTKARFSRTSILPSRSRTPTLN